MVAGVGCLPRGAGSRPSSGICPAAIRALLRAVAVAQRQRRLLQATSPGISRDFRSEIDSPDTGATGILAFRAGATPGHVSVSDTREVVSLRPGSYGWGLSDRVSTKLGSDFSHGSSSQTRAADRF